MTLKTRIKIIIVAGARPNFMKIAPLMAEFIKYDEFESLLVHTGQHYDEQMSDLFFKQLKIPEPDINLEVGSASHAVQTALIMQAFEPVVLNYKPDVVLVVGDVNSTIACGLVAVKLGVKLAHIEAGLRSGDRTMPEEINRILTDSISDYLFCTEQSGIDNLLNEGVPQYKIHMVGNVMIDTLLMNFKKAQKSAIISNLSRSGVNGKEYAVLTLHRPSNVDNFDVFSSILNALEVIQRDLPIVFPIHPRTRKNLDVLRLDKQLAKMPNIYMLDPVGYLDFLKLISSAKIVFTDSGGIQEETTILKVPCITLRENTERPVTTVLGTNFVAGTNTDRILMAYKKALNTDWSQSQTPPLWDGKAASRIVNVLLNISRDRGHIIPVEKQIYAEL